jgi:class 3 adenylate cyclase
VTNLANRLCDLAGSGDILASQRVHAEVGERVYSEDLGEVTILGLQRPVPAFKLLDYRGAER